MESDDRLKRLSEEELLSEFLPKESAVHLIREYRSIYQIMIHVPKTELEAVCGIGSARLKKIAYISEVMSRVQEGRNRKLRGFKVRQM